MAGKVKDNFVCYFSRLRGNKDMITFKSRFIKFKRSNHQNNYWYQQYNRNDKYGVWGKMRVYRFSVNDAMGKVINSIANPMHTASKPKPFSKHYGNGKQNT